MQIKDNNNNGAGQTLTMEVRLEWRPEKTCHKKKTLGKKQEIWVGTMAHALATGSLFYGRLYKRKTVDRAVKKPGKTRKKKLNRAPNTVNSEA